MGTFGTQPMPTCILSFWTSTLFSELPLSPAAIVTVKGIILHAKAQAGVFSASFYAVRAVKPVAGAINFWLLSMNMRDGLKLAGRLRPKKAFV